MDNKTHMYSTNKAKLVFRMYHVFLCDDDAEYLANLKNRVSSFIQSNNIAAKIYTFSSMESISDQLLKTCDIAILDIDFTGKDYSGIDIAKRLRTFRNDAVIIFATNFIEYAPEGYEVQAFRYILKHDIPKKLDDYLHQAIKRLHADNETIKFQINGEVIDIPLAQILYIEAQLHTVKVFVQAQDILLLLLILSALLSWSEMFVGLFLGIALVSVLLCLAYISNLEVLLCSTKRMRS